MRYRPRTDANQSEIVKALRQAGCSVCIIAGMGKGVPDLLVGKHGTNLLFEVKDPTKVPSQRKLSDDEKAWHCAWLGQVAIVETAEDALRVTSWL
jgi:Holliday junction resolvase